MTKCPVCSYSLEGLPATYQCPECGFRYDPQCFVIRARHKWTRWLGLAFVSVGFVPLAIMMLARNHLVIASIMFAIVAFCTVAAILPLRFRVAAATIDGVVFVERNRRTKIYPWRVIASAKISTNAGWFEMRSPEGKLVFSCAAVELGGRESVQQLVTAVNILKKVYDREGIH